MSPDLATMAQESATKFILALFVDLRGKPCAKLVPVEAVDLLATEGVGFAGYAVGAMGQEPKTLT
jgi:glutamine synthetase